MHSIYEQEEQARTLIWNSDFPTKLILDETTVFFEEKRREATRDAIEKLLDVMEEEMEMADLNMDKEFLANLDKALPPASGSNDPVVGIEENWYRTWERQADLDKALPTASGSNVTGVGIEENWCRTWSSRQFDSE